MGISTCLKSVAFNETCMKLPNDFSKLHVHYTVFIFLIFKTCNLIPIIHIYII